MTWWLHSQGDCVWGAGQTPDVRTQDPSGPDQVQSLSGLIGSDFVITGEILFLGPRQGRRPAPLGAAEDAHCVRDGRDHPA